MNKKYGTIKDIKISWRWAELPRPDTALLNDEEDIGIVRISMEKFLNDVTVEYFEDGEDVCINVYKMDYFVCIPKQELPKNLFVLVKKSYDRDEWDTIRQASADEFRKALTRGRNEG